MKQQIGVYQLLEEIGVGGMGMVYRGIDTRTQQLVAIKQLKSEMTQPEIIERFQREGEALRQLNHPNIVKMLDALEDAGQHYLVMEYIPTGDLNALLKNNRLSIRRILEIMLDLADALTRAHRLNIIHRDLKPANILIAEDGTPRLTDFGVAHFGKYERTTEDGVAVGTLDYLSPEALHGEANAFTDIWAFGVILFEMLTGESPFVGDTPSQIITQILTAPIPDLEMLCPDAPVALVDLVYRMLERDPQARITSVRYIGAELEAILHGRETSSQIPSFPLKERFTLPTSEIAQSPKHNLPAQTTPFVGRETELIELTRLITDPKVRLLTIMAPGGMGKTRLSIETAERQRDNFDDGVYLVELAPLTDAESIPIVIADAVGYHLQSNGRDVKQQVLDHLRHKQLLLVLDNFEHLIESTGIVDEILRHAPAVKVIATSRIRLNQHGETLFHLGGLDLPAWETPEDAKDYAAVKLFINSAKRAQPSFELTADMLQDVAQICRLVGGMPLGIVLAAAWSAMLSPAEITSEIEQGIDFLADEAGEMPDRQHSIRAIFDYSWQMLTSDEQNVFMKLTIFRGGMTREAAEVVAGANLRNLMSLINKSLIRRDTQTGRYEIHELLRQYAEKKLQTSGNLPATEKAHATYFADWMHKENVIIFSDKQLEGIAHIHDEFENLRVAWYSNLKYVQIPQLMHMQESFWLYCHIANRFDDAIKFYGDAGNALAQLPEQTQQIKMSQAIIQAKQAMPMHLRGKYEEAQQLALNSQETLRQLAIIDGYVEFFLIWTSSTQERYEESKKALAYFYEHQPNNQHILHIEMCMAAVAMQLGKIEATKQHIQKALEPIANAPLWTKAWCYLYVAFVNMGLGNDSEALSQLQPANGYFQQLGDAMGLYYSNRHMATIHHRNKHPKRAIAHIARALQTVVMYHHLRLVPETIGLLCDFLLEIGDSATAKLVYHASLQDEDVADIMRENQTSFSDEVTHLSNITSESLQPLLQVLIPLTSGDA